ncbi:MAG: bifunctional phosphopantothenoylcysteine decarboxylase/phosphopantothenate--cysteine ligase CoaBC [Rhodanobacteraceae bacterium]
MSRILLGISGGIAAYKSCELCRGLRAAGHEVRVVMTANAERFVGSASLQALSGQPVRTSLWDEAAEAAMGHIELARWADRILIAPATADIMARLAHGRADDLLTTLCLASAAPVWLAPAMNQQMWAHAATRANADLLRARGVTLLGPGEGEQACGDVGPGRMLEPGQIVAALGMDRDDGALAGLRVVVSAGPTFEDIDPVRYIGNRSSGRMGFAVAAAAARAGAHVRLVAGPVHLPTPDGVAARTDVRSAAEMLAAMQASASDADIMIAAAAVADYRPRSQAAEKLKKSADSKAPDLDLVQNPDILASLSQHKPRPFLVGFAAETGDHEKHARAKLETKGIDMIAANLVGRDRGFDRPDNALSVYWRDGGQALPQQSKEALAEKLVGLISQRYRAQAGDRNAS